MPTSDRTLSMFFRSLVSSVPSTMILPCWCSSSRLMQRISVDLPDPDGPQMTIRSPHDGHVDVAQDVELTRTTCSCRDLDRDFVLTCIGCGRSCVRWLDMVKGSLTVVGLQLAFQVHRVPRHAEAEDEEDGADKDVGLPVDALPVDVGADDLA
jgi:hypothetical protein